MEWIPVAIEALRIIVELIGAAAIAAPMVKGSSTTTTARRARDLLHLLAQNRGHANHP